MISPPTRWVGAVAALLSLASAAHGQWRSETYSLEPGWNAVYTFIDTTDRSLNELLGSGSAANIEEIWCWDAGASDAAIVGFQSTIVSGSEWNVWRRSSPGDSTTAYLPPNSACLIKVADDAPAFELTLKGKAVVPRVAWRRDGLNLVGFPIAEGTNARIQDYLVPSQVVDEGTEIYRYVGGDLGENNPSRLIPRTASLNRNEAYWARSGSYADYYGPLRVDVALSDGLDYGAAGTTKRLVLTNRANQSLDVTLTPTLSETDPSGSAAPTQPSLLLQGENGYVPFGNSHTVTVPANSTVGLTVAIDRTAMAGSPGDQYAGLLKVTDSAALTEVYLPITAEVGDLRGLWVGEAEITHVQNQLQRFQKEDDGTYSDRFGR